MEPKIFMKESASQNQVENFTENMGTKIELRLQIKTMKIGF